MCSSWRGILMAHIGRDWETHYHCWATDDFGQLGSAVGLFKLFTPWMVSQGLQKTGIRKLGNSSLTYELIISILDHITGTVVVVLGVVVIMLAIIVVIIVINILLLFLVHIVQFENPLLTPALIIPDLITSLIGPRCISYVSQTTHMYATKTHRLKAFLFKAVILPLFYLSCRSGQSHRENGVNWDIVDCTLYNVQCTMYNVYCTSTRPEIYVTEPIETTKSDRSSCGRFD